MNKSEDERRAGETDDHLDAAIERAIDDGSRAQALSSLTLHQRAARLVMTLGVILLALTLILGSISSVRDTVTSRLFPPAPTPDLRFTHFPGLFRRTCAAGVA